jgi:hypothetical protein
MNTDNEIRREVQSKFNDYRAPVPADGWDRLEQALNADAASRMVVRRRWVAASAAAIVILLVGSLLFFPPSTEQTPPMISDAGSQVAVPAPRHKRKTISPAKSERQSATPLLSGRTTLKPKDSAVPDIDVSGLIASWLQRESAGLVKAKRNVAENDYGSAIKGFKQDEAHPEKNESEEAFITAGGVQEDLFAGNMTGRKEEEQVVLAINGRGGLAPFQQTVNSPMTLRSARYAEDDPSAAAPKMMIAANNTADNVSAMEHDQPVSFGITVSKSLSDNLSVETGLVYTYLSSKARNSGTSFEVQETQHLHYVGIPVNINYNLFSVKKIDVYASVGGMIEKDVYGEYRRIGEGQSTELNISSQEEEITKISQANPQISVNAGMGISYPVYHHLKLYGKIGGAYYFDANNAYKTIYSDSKIVMDLHVGLRYEFK